MTSFVRGETILVEAVFTDSDGDPVTPSGATLWLSYKRNGRRVSVSQAMTLLVGEWFTNWESNAADAGTVFYRIVSDGSPTAIAEGELTLTDSLADQR